MIPTTFGFYTVENIINHPNWPKDDQSICGDIRKDRIVNGKTAAFGEFPFIARLGVILNSELKLN